MSHPSRDAKCWTDAGARRRTHETNRAPEALLGSHSRPRCPLCADVAFRSATGRSCSGQAAGIDVQDVSGSSNRHDQCAARTLSDWALISGIFFATLPASLLGLVAPRHAGVALATVAVVAAAVVSIREGALPWRLWLLYTAPAALVGIGRFWTARERNRLPPP